MKRLSFFLICCVGVASCSSGARSTDRVSSTPTTSGGFINGGPCRPSDIPRLGSNAGCVTTAHAEDATLFVYAIVGGDSLPRKWRIRYETDVDSIDQPLDAGNPFSYPRAIASVDVNDDGAEEWLIKNTDLASHGTNWQRLQLFVVEEDALVPIAFGAEPLWVNVGGTSRLGEGARCEAGKFVLLRVWAKNRINTRWAYSQRWYEIEGSRATFVERTEGLLRLTDYNDPDLDPYYQFTCADLLYP